MKKLIGVTIAFMILLAGGAFAAVHTARSQSGYKGEALVALNEAENLMQQGDTEGALEACGKVRSDIEAEHSSDSGVTGILVMSGACGAVMLVYSLYMGIKVIRPFERLKGHANRIAQGDLETQLERDRSDYFGKFTWAFDSMRRELIKARACEKEAIENNKTVIASLSHDIKTPVASIRSYAEALEMGMNASPEKTAQYISVIIRKCDEVAKLTEDMLLHSLSDLKMLKITPENFELGEFTEQQVRELSEQKGDVIFEKPAYFAEVYADKMRTAQIIENLINNARKYAKTDITITITRSGDMYEIHFKDTGGGIPDEDIPFIFNKFYRGRNCGNENGSGLGLYIVKYIARQSGGDASLRNTESGLEVTVTLPAAGEPPTAQGTKQ